MNFNDIVQRRRAVYPNQYENTEIEDSFIKLLLKNANTTYTQAYTTLVLRYKSDSKGNLAIEMANCYEQFSNGSNHIEIKKKNN